MATNVNLSHKIEKLLPRQLVEFMESSGLIAGKMGWHLYLVGGTVRDLLLGRPNYDIDMVVEGDALSLGERLAATKGAKITVHSRFGTVKLRWQGWTIDIATARKETYAKPGALPEPEPASLAEDLFRRDFTVNSMAVELFSGRWGQLIDLHGGQRDLSEKKIRIMHNNSFVDDSTRIWRAVRYEQRLNFTIEPDTLRCIKRDIDRLEGISSDRIRHELELVLTESTPEKALIRAGKLGVLAKINPALTASEWLVQKLQAAREYSYPEQPPFAVYLSLLVYKMSASEAGNVVAFLRLPRGEALVVNETCTLKHQLKPLGKPILKRSAMCALLGRFPSASVEANLIAVDSPLVKKRLQLFLTKLRYVKSEINGEDILKLGVPPGPWVKEILQRLTDARLDSIVRSRKGEEALAKNWLS